MSRAPVRCELFASPRARSHRARVALVRLAIGMLLAGCARHSAPDPSPLDCPVFTVESGFRAGFGRADLTTPPGPGLFGYGPDAQAAAGYRQRIFARAVVVQDARGERIALVSVDLGFVSGALHRAAAKRVEQCSGLGPDRLVLSATHTHSAPGHYAAHKAYDQFGSSVPGHDPALLDFMASQVARSVLDAIGALRPAHAAWGIRPVWGITRIRSWTAHAAEDHPWPTAFEPPADLPQDVRHVDPTLLVLRIDTVGQRGPAPAGAYGIFAAHGTGNPAANDLIDGDLFAGAQRMLEQHIDGLNGLPRGFRRAAIAVLANGAEGDIVATRDTTGCEAPILRRGHRPGDFRSPPAPEVWMGVPERVSACIAQARQTMATFGHRLGTEAILLYDSLGAVLRGDLLVGLAFETVALRGSAAIPGLCSRGRTGSAAVAGAELGRTRVAGWRLGGFYGLGIEEGGSAVRPSGDCHSPKRTLPAFVERLVTGSHSFEEAAQFSALRIGPALLATVPFEPTTTAAARMRAALRQATANAADPPRLVGLIGLTNGYLQYVTTAAEYARQHYEGASTLYGPASAVVFTDRLAGLAQRLAENDWASPPPGNAPFPTFPGPAKSILPARRTRDPAPRASVYRLFCTDDAVILHWYDAAPGALFPADGQLIAVDAQIDGSWREQAWDDDPALEVRALRPSRQGYIWEARWELRAADGSYRYRLPRASGPGATSRTFQIAAGRCRH